MNMRHKALPHPGHREQKGCRCLVHMKVHQLRLFLSSKKLEGVLVKKCFPLSRQHPAAHMDASSALSGCLRVGGLWVAPLSVSVNVPFPPLSLRPWSGHFYASDSFMKHKTRSDTWHEIGNKAEQKEEQFSGRMW